jgi:four helix bundle protein
VRYDFEVRRAGLRPSLFDASRASPSRFSTSGLRPSFSSEPKRFGLTPKSERERASKSPRPEAAASNPNQVVGASLSIMGNVAEANGREKEPGEVEQHCRYAQGSTFESAGYLDALSALEVIDDDEYNVQEEHLARIAAMLTRLMQSHRRRRPRGSAAMPLEKRGPQARASKSPRRRASKRASSPRSPYHD